ncbi:MAG: glycosyltransferase [Bacteroidaceae bacterium]|nr:glycosyltransferase [Bacteroidaceae bacterium]
MYSPVAIFVYNRLENTQKTLEHLLANTLAKETDVFVFSDGAKKLQDGSIDKKSKSEVETVRNFLRTKKTDIDSSKRFKSFTIIERKENIYLEANILTGIDFIFEHYDTIIVLEDDICTSPYYLEYMNQAFELYKDSPKVMHVSGFTNLDLWDNSKNIDKIEDFYFTPHMSGWGWGTWKNRWEKFFIHFKTRHEALQGMNQEDIDAFQYDGHFPCLKSLDRNPIPWDICWELCIYKSKGLCLTPSHTLVRNIGLKNGTHFRSFDLLQSYEFDREPSQRPLKLYKIENPEKNKNIENLFAQAITDWGIRYTILGKILRFLYKKVVKRCNHSNFLFSNTF